MKKSRLSNIMVGLFLMVLSLNLPINAQQINSFIVGTVVDGKDGETLLGAHVEVIHVSTGTKYHATTNSKGMYRIANVRPGGPYTIKIIYLGYSDHTMSNVQFSLGETSDFLHKLIESSTQLNELVVTGNKQSQFQDNKMGTQTVVSGEKIAAMPNAGRSIGDFVRFSPLVKVTPAGAISVAGQNNRYNSFTVDGAPQNDTYGLAPNGTNSGQIGFTPFSMDVIDQISIQLSPYDVKQSGFSGAGISASTKSGTNELKVSFYDYFRNQALAGKIPTNNPNEKYAPLPDFTSNTVGLSIGGPIIKNKLFFFVNGEFQKENMPRAFDYNAYNPNDNTSNKATQEELSTLRNYMTNNYGYDPGSYSGITNNLTGGRLFAKLDWNINERNKLTLRYNMTKGSKEMPGISSSSAILFSNYGKSISSSVHSLGAELKSKVNETMSNYLFIGYNKVTDDQNPLGGYFPVIAISNPKITLGSEEFSSANKVNQNIITLENNFEWYKGAHTFTFGTHNEFFNMYNLFMGNNFGKYTYDTLDQFLSGNPATQYDRQFSKMDNITGDGSAAAARFNVLQLGFYAQDEWKITRNFKLNYGLRVDIPIFLTNTPTNTHFNDSSLPQFIDAWKEANAGNPFAENPARTGTKIRPSVHFSPRIGFNWDITGEKQHQLRGGIGLFTSRIPYVWPGGMYSNNGMNIGSMRVNQVGAPELVLNPNWNNQPTLPGTQPSGNIDLFAENFKFPQVLRANIGYDVKLPFGIVGIFDAIFTKDVNSVLYQNLSVVPTSEHLTGTGDDRHLYEKIDRLKYPEAAKYTSVYLASNTSEGYGYSLSASLEKNFDFGLSLNAGYSFNHSKSINDGQSSQNSSQWRNSTMYGSNEPTLKTSIYDAGSRVVASASYRVNYTKYASTIISLFYTGAHGGRYGYGYNVFSFSNTGLLGDNVNSNHQMSMYVPKDRNDIHLVPLKDGKGNIIDEATQWTALDKYINNDPYLSKMRGRVVEPNSCFTPWQNIVDAKLIQEFKLPQRNGRVHRLQISFDVYNLGNMLNQNWGRMYTAKADYDAHQLLTFQGYVPGTKTPTFTTTNYNVATGELNRPYNINYNTSNLQTTCWQAQVGVKYIF